jgi:hypothetical protein
MSSDERREHLLSIVLMLSDTSGEGIGLLTSRLRSPEAFRVLRLLSGLRVETPGDQEAIGDLIGPQATAVLFDGTVRSLVFPPFRDLLKMTERVQCYLLCKKLGDWKMVAQRMGLKDSEVRRNYKAVADRLKGVTL